MLKGDENPFLILKKRCPLILVVTFIKSVDRHIRTRKFYTLNLFDYLIHFEFVMKLLNSQSLFVSDVADKQRSIQQ